MSKREKAIERIWDNMEETISDELEKNRELKALWKEFTELEEELNNCLKRPENDIFNDYINKQLDILMLENKLSFKYGFNLSNKLFIESLRD